MREMLTYPINKTINSKFISCTFIRFQLIPYSKCCLFSAKLLLCGIFNRTVSTAKQ